MKYKGFRDDTTKTIADKLSISSLVCHKRLLNDCPYDRDFEVEDETDCMDCEYWEDDDDEETD